MNGKRAQLLLTGVAAWISLLLMITTTYGGGIVIGGNYTKIGTIVVISPNPGDTPQTNGTALLNNLSAIPSDPNQPYLIKLGPGIYDIGANSLQMKQYVHIEGSGKTVTTITGNPSSTGYCSAQGGAVLYGALGAEIRSLTVTNAGATGTYAVAIMNTSGSSPTLKDVGAYVSSSGTSYNYAILNCPGNPEMLNVSVGAVCPFGEPA